MDESTGGEVGFRDNLTIFLVSCTVMIYQIALTRVLSVVAWYHFAFLTISIVMLGMGAPGVWFALTRSRLRVLPWLLLASGITVPTSVILIVQFGAAMIDVSIVAIILCVLPATLSLGGVVCLILIEAEGPAIGRTYGADLLGAALGAALIIPLLHAFPTPQIIAASGILPLSCLVAHRGVMARVALLGVFVIVALMLQGELLRVTHSKNYDETRFPPIHERWTPTARLTVFDESFRAIDQQRTGFSWGRGRNFPAKQTIDQYWLEQDGSAGTPITRFSGDLEQLSHLLFDVTSVGYEVRPPKTVAVIGAGGGRDILAARLAGAERVDAVELNPHTIELVSDRFGDFSGDVYHLPGVEAVANEGRSHLTRTRNRFDLIQISLIDSWAASTAGAFALAENNLYTVEAFELYSQKLSPGGLIVTSRWLAEIPRLIVLARAALEEMGIEEPGHHMLLVATDYVGTLMISPSPFGPGDLARADQACLDRGFDRVFPIPAGQRATNPFLARLASQGSAPLADLGLNVDPPTDDSPYFFHIVSPFSDPKRLPEAAMRATGFDFNLQSTVVLRQAMVAVSALAALLFMLPFVARALGGHRHRGSLAELARASAYFAAIGSAFMLLENMLVQKFVLYLGHPSYATTVIIASLLLGMGIGSSIAPRLRLRGLKRIGMIVPFLVSGLVVALPPLFDAGLGHPLVLRIGISCVILCPLGATLGLYFPLGMLRFGDESKPWFWAINGAFGVVASVMSLALSMEFGFMAVGFSSAAAYGIAWMCLYHTPES